MEELEFVRRVRRALHRRPELGHREWWTAGYVERVLRLLGCRTFRPAATSVASVIGPAGRPVVGFRADLDALPTLERTGAAYASRNRGVMHSCGHDGHAAALLALARRLVRAPGREPVLLVFQQAEETYPSGAPAVLAGIPADRLPAEMFAFHLWPELPQGVVGVRAGTMMASVAGIVIEVRGSVGRSTGTLAGAGTVDAIAAGVELYRRLRPDAGRRLEEGRTPSALGIGLIGGGERPNGVPGSCRLEGTLRALSWADERAAVAAMTGEAAAVAAATGAEIEVTVTSGIRPPVRNDAGSVARVVAACERLGISHREYPDRPAGVSEDFGWFLERTGGALALLGCATRESHPALHEADFDFDEAVLIAAVDLWHALATAHRGREDG